MLTLWLISAVMSILMLAEMYKDEPDYIKLMLISSVMSLILGPFLTAGLLALKGLGKLLFK